MLLSIRITIGSGYFLAGRGKLVNFDHTASALESRGILAPGFNAGLLSVVEMIGGLLLVTGLLSRVTAVYLAISLVTAYIIAHGEDYFWGINGFTYAAPGTFLLGSLVIFAFGTGRIALDTVLAKFTCKSWQS